LLQKAQFRGGFWRPWINLVVGRDDLIGVRAQKLAERRDIQSMMSRTKTRQILFRQPKQAYSWRQTPAVFRVRRMFESLLQMNEGAGRLDQALEKIRVAGFRLQPKLLENIVRFIVTLLVPAPKKSAIKWVLCDIGLSQIDLVCAQLRHKSRNPLAFVHEELNLQVALMMSKQARIIFFRVNGPPGSDGGMPARLCYNR
jgi:hypothetical protein